MVEPLVITRRLQLNQPYKVLLTSVSKRNAPEHSALTERRALQLSQG